jgi:ribonuclease E
LFGKLMAWMKSFGEEAQPVAKPAALNRSRNGPRPERSERGEGGNKRRERGGRKDGNEAGKNRDRNEPRNKPASAEVATKPQESIEPREPREPRQPRPPRPPRAANENIQQPRGAANQNAQPVAAQEKPVLEIQASAPAMEQTETGGSPSARRRGRRGGRREREQREGAAQATAPVAQNGEAVMVQQSFVQMDTAPTTPVVNAKPTEYIAVPEGYVYPSEYVAMPTASAVIAAPAPIKASSNSNLIQIETDPSKAQAVASMSANYTDKPATRRRTRQREVYVESEPLVQIETHH